MYAELLHDAANSACEIVLSTKSEAAVIVNVAVFDWEGGAWCHSTHLIRHRSPNREDTSTDLHTNYTFPHE